MVSSEVLRRGSREQQEKICSRRPFFLSVNFSKMIEDFFFARQLKEGERWL